MREITEKKSIEEELKISQNELLALKKINTAFLTIHDEEVYGAILLIILETLKSRYGVFGYIDERGNYICPSLTRDIWDECQMPDKTITYPRSSWGGIWGRAMLEGEIKYNNEPFIVPEGHIQIQNALDVPILHKGVLIGNILVGNKENGYDKNDIQLLESISNSLSPILYNRLRIEGKEQKLKESEEKFRGFLDFGNIGMAITSVDKKWVYCNDQICELFGFTRDELFEKTWADLSYPEDLQSDVEQFNNIIDGKIDSYQIDKRYIKKNREIYYAHLTVSCIRNSDGTVKYFLATLQDITERKKGEQKLRESEEKYRLIFENSPAGISIADLNGYVYIMNKKMSEITGYTIEELNKIGLGNTYVNPDDLEKAVEILNSEGKVRNYLSKLKDKKGREYDALFNIDVINTEGKKLLLTNLEDTRELDDLKASLFEKDLLARIFMENISGFVVLLKPGTREIIAMNKYAKDMGGIPGLTCYSTIGQSETPCPWCLAPKLWKTREAQHLIVDALDISWDTYWSPISDDLYLHYGFDVTDQAKREKNLKELDQIKSQLLRRASHELKTPLVSIKGFTNLLLNLKAEEFESKAFSIVQEIKDGCLRLEHLVNDIMIASKLESSQPELSKSLENLSELTISAVNALKGFAQTRNQKILIDLPKELLTMLDKDRIQEVLTNLISNAIKYTQKYGTIKLKSKTNKGYFVIIIEDNGIGFTPEEEKNIFTQFGKIERYGQGFDVVSEGSGLGLYIAKKILTHHKGSIWLESEGRNKGTTFFFSLPIIKE